jgi:methyl-accepting chemotaxis protein
MTIKIKLIAGFLAVTLLTAVLGYFGYSTQETQSRVVGDLVDKDFAYYRTARDVSETMLRINRHAKLVFLNIGNARMQATHDQGIQTEVDRLRASIKQLIAIGDSHAFLPEKARATARELPDLLSEYVKGLKSATHKSMNDPSITPQQADKLMTSYKDAVRQLEDDTASLAKAAGLLLTRQTDKFLADVVSSEKTLLWMLVCALALALILAAVSTVSIVRPLSGLVTALAAVRKGDFSVSLATERKDEVGKVARTASHMISTVQDALHELGNVSREIRAGRLNKRGDASRFQGEFARLVEDTNALTDSLVGFFDNLPTPVMAIDNDFTILYMNKAGAEVGNTTPAKLNGTKCHDHFRTGDCKSDRCACNKAMRSQTKEQSDTQANPGGVVDLDIDYIAVPIVDDDNKVRGAFEIVMDQTEVRAGQRRILAAADKTTTAVEHLSSAAEELSAQVEQSSRGADEQRGMTTEAATAMEQMNATVIEVARNASSAATSADEAKANAQEGEHIVEQVIKAIETVQAESNKLTANIDSLGAQAAEIGKVMTVITDIADQTNLLALNAAIEAARAGDAGRGFAVVADEVRKLAEKTMTATKEVGDAITSIQQATEANVEGMRHAEDAVNQSTGLAAKAGQALNSIVRIVDDTADQVRNIATASEEQSAASEQISRSVDDINRISNETADAMDQSASAITGLAELAGQLSELVGDMRS